MVVGWCREHMHSRETLLSNDPAHLGQGGFGCHVSTSQNAHLGKDLASSVAVRHEPTVALRRLLLFEMMVVVMMMVRMTMMMMVVVVVVILLVLSCSCVRVKNRAEMQRVTKKLSYMSCMLQQPI